jgi:site-specific DNA recombinase
MKSSLYPPLAPNSGSILKAILVCRISKVSQDERSLNDQENLLRQWLRDHYDGPIDIRVISGQGSGECLLRREALQLEEAVAEGRVDLVLAEDLGRVYRRLHALIFCETCEDVGTRVFALNDGLDTAQENWRMCGMFAAMRHEAYNQDTAKRIRRTLRNRFQQGGVVQTHIYGYIKPPGAKHDSELQKGPAAEPIYDRWFQILEDGGTYSDVADWLNEQRIPLGPWCRSSEWTCRMVGRITRNPLLKGVRERNRRMAKRVNKSGRHKSVAAPPEELLERHCPHLAFIEPARYDRVLRKLSVQNARCRRKKVDGVDPCLGVPKKRTRWPGQHLTCGVCGGLLVYGAHGQKEHLMCTASRDYRCWMTVSVNGPLARKKLTEANGTVVRVERGRRAGTGRRDLVISAGRG